MSLCHQKNWNFQQFFCSFKDLGPHDRNFFIRINNEKFLRGATERNTHQRQEVIFVRASEALKAQ